jgi:hypothetical protein
MFHVEPRIAPHAGSSCAQGRGIRRRLALSLIALAKLRPAEAVGAPLAHRTAWHPRGWGGTGSRRTGRPAQRQPIDRLGDKAHALLARGRSLTAGGVSVRDCAQTEEHPSTIRALHDRSADKRRDDGTVSSGPVIPGRGLASTAGTTTGLPRERRLASGACSTWNNDAAPRASSRGQPQAAPGDPAARNRRGAPA